MGVLEAGEGQPEVIEPMIERQAGDRDAESADIGEVRETKTTGRMLLAEHNLLLGAVERTPAGDAALQGPAHAPAAISGCRRRISSKTATARMPGVASSIATISPSRESGERIGAATPTWLLVRWQPRVGFNPVRGGGAEPGFGSRGGVPCV